VAQKFKDSIQTPWNVKKYTFNNSVNTRTLEAELTHENSSLGIFPSKRRSQPPQQSKKAFQSRDKGNSMFSTQQNAFKGHATMKGISDLVNSNEHSQEKFTL